jgi:hypothetical protein
MMQMGAVPQAVCMQTLRAWGREVIPHFRGATPDRRAPTGLRRSQCRTTGTEVGILKKVPVT